MSEKTKKEKKEKAPKMKTCPACKAEIPKKAKVCPHCAAKQKGKGPLPLILALVLVLVLGAGVSIVVFHFPIAPPFELPIGGGGNDSLLGQTMGMSVKEEEAAAAIFAECGFGEITEVRELSGTARSTSFGVQDVNTSRFLETEDPIIVQMVNETKVVEAITFQDQDIYRNGQMVTPVTEFYLGLEEREQYLSQCLTAVRSRLDIPETAVFPSRSKWSYTMDGEKVTVRSTVTSKDSSGKEVTRAFVVEFENGDFVSLTFEDQESEEE